MGWLLRPMVPAIAFRLNAAQLCDTDGTPMHDLWSSAHASMRCTRPRIKCSEIETD